MNMGDATKLIHPALFRIHLIKCSDGAGATTLLTTMGKSSNQKFKMDDDFTVCVIKHEGENIHLQVWDDNDLARQSSHYKEADVEIFLVDVTNENGLNSTILTLQNHTTQNSPRTIRMLVANKVDALDEDERDEMDTTLERIGRQFNLDGCALINATSTDDVKDLVNDITDAAVCRRNFFENEAELRQKMIVEIKEKIGSLSPSKSLGFLSGLTENKALNDAKKTGLTQLANALLKQKDTPIAEIVTDIRTRYPKLDSGKTSQKTKTMLDRFIAESATISTHKSSHSEEKSSAANETTRRYN
jgi:GTPase SAR1 family protein